MNSYRPFLSMTRTVIAPPDFAAFTNSLVGLPIGHIWQGYGSALFFELGDLVPSTRRRRDGTLGNPKGEWTLSIEWSWRIEGKRRIWCGSWSDVERSARVFSKLQEAEVVSVSLMGRLPEIDVTLNNGLHIVSCMTVEGDPEWGLTRRDSEGSSSVSVVAGRLTLSRCLAAHTPSDP